MNARPQPSAGNWHLATVKLEMLTQSKSQKPAKSYKAPVPAYQRIEQELRRQIQQGRWQPEEPLPTRQALAQEFHVGMSTLQQAVTNLIATGSLREEGRATLVGNGSGGVATRRSVSHLSSISNAFHLSLPATATVGIVGMMPTDESGAANSWVPTLLRSVEKRLADEDQGSRFFNRSPVPGGFVPLAEAVTALLDDGASGIVALLEDDMSNIRAATEAAEVRRAPLVFITSEAIDLPVPHVFYDSRSAGHQAAQHLIRQGYRDLVFLSPFTTLWTAERLAGARSAAQIAETTGVSLRVVPPEAEATLWVTELGNPEIQQFYEQQSYDLALGLLRGCSSRPGIIASNDYMALSVARAAADLGLTLGRDVGLVGFDDLPAARQQGLTSLRPPLEALGEEAARLLVSALQGERFSWQVRLRSHLLPRRSTQLRD